MATKDSAIAIYFCRVTYYLGTVIAAAFFYFFLTYPEDKRPKKYLSTLLVVIELVLGYIFIFSNLIIYGVLRVQEPHPWVWQFGSFSFLFELFYFGFFVLGILILYRKYLHLRNKHSIMINLRYMLCAIIVGAFPPSLICVILPRFGYFTLNWLGPVSEIIWIPIIAYSIIKYRQMNVRVVGTEVLVLTMIILSFLNIFLGISFVVYARIGLFLVFAVLGYALIRSLVREDAQKEQLNAMNTTLAQKVAEQTHEIRHAYELEKRARLELEKLNDAKDQFIMITQHHLRTPTSSIKWELESLLKGDYGKLTTEQTAALVNSQASTERLMRIVNDFLSITAIKAGTNILNISSCSLKPAISDILAELETDIEALGIAVTYPKDEASWPVLKLDCSKIKESLFIVIENAIRYNRRAGTVKILTDVGGGGKPFVLIIENTGIGITSEESSKIGTALFYRGEHARTAHATGMGIGLSVVKAIVKAHHGHFSIVSAGRDSGAKVRIELPR